MDSDEKWARSVLGIACAGKTRKVVQSDVRRAYKELALKLHPDRNVGPGCDPNAFQELHRAYEILMRSSGATIPSASSSAEEFDRKWADQAASLRAAAAAQWRKQQPRTAQTTCPRNLEKKVMVPPPVQKRTPHSPPVELPIPEAPVGLRLREVLGRNAVLRAEAEAANDLVKAFCAL